MSAKLDKETDELLAAIRANNIVQRNVRRWRNTHQNFVHLTSEEVAWKEEMEKRRRQRGYAFDGLPLVSVAENWPKQYELECRITNKKL